MEDIKDKIKAAKKEGFTDVQIVDFLAQLPDVGPQVTTALENQYKPDEILKFLGQSPAYREGTQAPTLQRAAVTAMQGPTFEFLDELAGAVSAPVKALQQGIPLGEAYRQGRDFVRGQTESFQAERPFTAGGAQLAASLPLSLAGAPARLGSMMLPALQRTAPSVAPTVQRAGTYLAGAPTTGQAMGMGQRMVQAGASGGGYGFVSGVGASTADNPLDVLSDAATSAVFGAGLGAGTQPVQSVLGMAGRQATARMMPTAAGTQAQQQVAQALIRDVPNPLDPGNALTRAQARLLKLGPEARIADVGGKSTRNLLDVQATLPGTTTDAVERAIRERQAGRAGRLMTAADESLGTQGAQYLAKLEDFSQQRFVDSRPYYAVVDSAMIKADDNILDLLNRSKGLLGNAQTEYLRETGKTIDLSNVQRGQNLPMKVLDVLKQTLYDEAQNLKQSQKAGSARNLDTIQRNLIQTLTEKSPKIGGQSAYAQALDKWAGPSQMRDAAEVGRKVMRGDILDVQQATQGLSQSEIDAFRIGALQALRQATGTESGQTSLLKMWKEPATQERLKAAFGNDYRTFAAAVAKEARLKGMESAGRGSQTAARLAGEADLDIAPLNQAVSAVASGNPSSIITAATNLARQVKTPESVRNEIGRILLSRDPRQLEQLSEVIRQLNRSRSRAAGVAGFGSGQIGSMVTGDPAP
jgi:hypothetical protein